MASPQVGAAVLKKPRHRGARASQEKRAHGEQEARRLLAEGLAVAGLSEAALKKLPGSDARKVAVARVIWEQTTVDMTWLAGHLHLRSAALFPPCLHSGSRRPRSRSPCPPARHRNGVSPHRYVPKALR